MIGSSNFSRNFFHSGSRGSGVRRLPPKRCRLAATPSAVRPLSGEVGRSLRMSRMMRMGRGGQRSRRRNSQAHGLRPVGPTGRRPWAWLRIPSCWLLFHHFLALLVGHLLDLVLVLLGQLLHVVLEAVEVVLGD